MKKTDNLLILVGDNEYTLNEGEFKGNNKDFLKDHSVNLKSDIYRLEYATQKLNKDSIKIITNKDAKLWK